jgi:hypothetical protein
MQPGIRVARYVLQPTEWGATANRLACFDIHATNQALWLTQQTKRSKHSLTVL